MNSISFQEKIKYNFHDETLLEVALTHSSYARERHGEKSGNGDNERLEFIGDGFLDAIVGVELYNLMKKENEGKLTKTRALVVCEKSLAEEGMNLNLGKYLKMGKGEILSGGRMRESIIADAMEAVIGAIYLDGGYEQAKDFVLRTFSKKIEDAIAGKLYVDYKTKVQEVLQGRGCQVVISYITDKADGPDHDKTFYVHLECNGKKYGSGNGKSKKEAEQNAAKATLKEIGNVL